MLLKLLIPIRPQHRGKRLLDVAPELLDRQKVLEVAQEVFAKEGLSVPIDQIARRAGLGVGTLYRHFPTKEALFEAIVVGRMEKLVDFFPSPGLLSERMWVFLATRLTAGAARPEEDERITIRRFSAGEIERMMRKGAGLDGKSLAGILFYWRFRKNRR